MKTEAFSTEIFLLGRAQKQSSPFFKKNFFFITGSLILYLFILERLFLSSSKSIDFIIIQSILSRARELNDALDVTLQDLEENKKQQQEK